MLFKEELFREARHIFPKVYVKSTVSFNKPENPYSSHKQGPVFNSSFNVTTELK